MRLTTDSSLRELAGVIMALAVAHIPHRSRYLDYATSAEPVSLSYSLPPQSIRDLPLNSRLTLPKLLSRILALKCHLRDRLAYAYRNQDWEELHALGGPLSNSRMHRLRALVDQLWRYHMGLWMATYKVLHASLWRRWCRLNDLGPQPFGWEVLELRYGGLRARLETMHVRLMAFLDSDDSSVTRLEELEVQTETAYPGSGCMMMLGAIFPSRQRSISDNVPRRLSSRLSSDILLTGSV